MLVKHFSHMLYEPKHSLEDADREPASLTDIILHTAILSLIPTVCGYIATVHIGWDLGAGAKFLLPADQGAMIAVAAFLAFNLGVYLIGYGIQWLATTFDVKPNYLHCLELALFTSLPLFLLGFVALYPVLYIDIIIGMLALAASVYLLYIGVPIFMHIPEDEGFVYSTWVVALGLVMIIVFLGFSVFFFSWIG